MEGTSIRLSVRSASIQKRPAPYQMRYRKVMSPLNFRFLMYRNSRMKPTRHQMLSYRKVGCTGRLGSMVTPFCTVTVLPIR